MHDTAGSAAPSFRHPIHSLIERFPELFDGEGTPRRGFTARHSRIDEFAARGKRPPVIVKTITISSSPEHAARVAGREFEALAWLHARVGNALRGSIPEPLAWIPGSPAIAMGKLDGVTVARLLRRYATRGAVWGGGPLERIGSAVGAWLRALHDATRCEDGTLEGPRLLAQIEAQLQAAARGGLDSQSTDRIRRLAESAVQRLADAPVPVAARQGDFTASNILLDGCCVRIVDFENFDEADAVYEDIASLSGYLRMLAQNPLYAASRIERFRRAFLRAYGQTDSDPTLALYELKHVLAVLGQFPAPASPIRRWRRRKIERGVMAVARRAGVEVVDYRAGAGDYRDASEYDARRYHGRTNEYKRRVMRTAYTTLIGQGHGLRLLDVGCGTGRGLADLSGTGVRLFGSDASVDMLARAASAGPDGTRPGLTAAYAQNLPFRDGSFDIVTSLNFLHLFSVETQRQMVAEMKRVVKPGGRLVLEFDNALNGGIVGPWKRWTGRERASLPSEIRFVIGDDCPVVRRRGAVFPVVWRWLARWPHVGEPLEKLGYLPGVRWLTHRMYCELRKPPA